MRWLRFTPRKIAMVWLEGLGTLKKNSMTSLQYHCHPFAAQLNNKNNNKSHVPKPEPGISPVFFLSFRPSFPYLLYVSAQCLEQLHCELDLCTGQSIFSH
jgi:hypothetical protein